MKPLVLWLLPWPEGAPLSTPRLAHLQTGTTVQSPREPARKDAVACDAAETARGPRAGRRENANRCNSAEQGLRPPSRCPRYSPLPLPQPHARPHAPAASPVPPGLHVEATEGQEACSLVKLSSSYLHLGKRTRTSKRVQVGVQTLCLPQASAHPS